VVVLHPQWLVDLLGTIMTTHHSHTKDGILKESSLPHIWKPPKFPEQLHPFLISLLDSFEVSFDITGKVSREATQAGQEPAPLRLIPSLLPEEPPAELASLWPVERQKAGGEWSPLPPSPPPPLGHSLDPRLINHPRGQGCGVPVWAGVQL